MRAAFLYPKLAAGGIAKNRRIYLPYILACSGMIMIYYITSFLSKSQFVAEIRGGDIMQGMLELGTYVMIIFSAIFLFYTNSFLIRRRKTEFGLYNILGMGKGSIARILVWETLFTFIVSEVCGLGCGILFSKLSELLLTKMLGGNGSYVFTVELVSVRNSFIWYAVIFALILINALRQIRLSNPIDLLRSDRSGEKPPRANWLGAVLGAILLGIAYYMAIAIENPISAIMAFFVAVLMVIIATYLLFIAGSVAICRLLQKNKRYYYKTSHFVSVSQMAYRMKRGGAGLASICILSTMVLVTISSTTCLYAGSENMLRNRYPRNIVLDIYTDDEEYTKLIRGIADKVLDEYNEVPQNILEYGYLDISGGFEGERVVLDPNKVDTLSNSVNPDIRQLFIVTVDDYNRLMNKQETLERDEAILYVTKDNWKYDTITLEEYGTFKVKSVAEDFLSNGVDAMQIVPSVFIFVKDKSVIKEIYDLQLGVYGSAHSFMHSYYGFDLSCDDDKQVAIATELNDRIREIKSVYAEDEWYGVGLDSSAYDKGEFYAMYGGLFFLGMLFSAVFICAAALIMYYKQLSEGFEDKERFGILQKVGMTKREIRRCVNSQVLTVFFLPLGAAAVHMVFAFPIVSRLLMLFGLTDTTFLALVTVCCLGAFAALYGAVYVLTSRSYYKIVSKD